MKEAPEPNRLLQNYLKKLEAHALFTDGSKNQNNFVGFACIYPDENRYLGRSISKTASVYTAECIAIYEAMMLISESKYDKFVILSDSLSALLSLKSANTCMKSNYYTFEIKKMQNEITARYPEKSIKFTWIPSHVGIEYNEAVDSLGNTLPNGPILKPSFIPFTDHHQEFKKYYFLKTNQSMINQGNFKGKNYFELYYKLKKNLVFTKKLLRGLYCPCKQMQS